MLQDLFNSSCNKIQDYYVSSGHNDEFRFLTCSKIAFRKDIPILLLDGRPGKNTLNYPYEKFSCEKGNAYFAEVWNKNGIGNAPIQKHMQAFYSDLAETFDAEKPVMRFAQEDVLSAYYNPFRDNCDGDEDFFKELWFPIFDQMLPSLIFTFSVVAYKGVTDYLSKFDTINNHQPISPVRENFKFSMKFAEGRKDNKRCFVVNLPTIDKYLYADKGGLQEISNAKMWQKVRDFLEN